MRQFTDSERIARDAAKSSSDVPYLTDDLEHYIFDTGFAAALYHTDRQLAALTAERDGLRAVYQEVVDFIETEEWTSMGTGELTPYERKVTALAEKLRRALDNPTT